MTAKCLFCKDTKIEPGIPGPCIWCEEIGPATTGAVERFTIAKLRYAGGAEHDVRYVSEAHYDAALGREAALREELESIKASVDGYDSPEHAAQVADEMGHQCDALQQRLTVAEQREAEAREELLELSRKLDVFYSRSHGIKNLSEIEKANDKAKDLKLKVCEYEVLLNISKELLTTISRHGATTKPVDWCDSFKAEVADRIEKIGAALKPAEGEGS